MLVYFANLWWARRHGAIAGDDPWGGNTLEWATPSPPPEYNFEMIPMVDSRSPLWTSPGRLPAVTGLRTDLRDVLITSAFDADIDHRHLQPRHSIWPFYLGLATAFTFIVGIFTPWAGPIGGVLATIALTGWFWPKGDYPVH
jgi:cytochrome c oxidase subunit 1